MGLIKKFIDFISSKNEAKPKIGSKFEYNHLSYKEVDRLYAMIKDYCSFNDIEGITIIWPTCQDHNGIAYFSNVPIDHALQTDLVHYITKLDKFSVVIQMKVDPGTNNDLLRSEVESAKKQLQEEDFNLIWNKRDFTPKIELEDGSVQYERYDKITISHKSFIEPKPIWKK